MHSAFRNGSRIAGLLVVVVFVAHCGDSDVRVSTGGVNPAAGTFAGATGQGGAIAIQVGSIEAIAFECGDGDISHTFSPPATVNSNGTFDVSFTGAGREFHVTGTFTNQNNVNGNIDDADDDCDTSFEAERTGPVASPTRTVTPGPGATKTPTPTEVVGTPETPTPTETTGGTGGSDTPTPTVTSTPSQACPSKIEFVGTSTGGVLDSGWTGQGHDATVVSNGKITVNADCSATTKPCGTCNVSGPVANVNAANYTSQTGSDINSQRCTNNTRTTCTSNGDCSGGTCAFYFGSPLPLAAGGISTCVTNRVIGPITGTANIESGSAASSVHLISTVFNQVTAESPCPRCLGDVTPNDGKREGTCDAGASSGQSCDINGSSPNAHFGSTSLDCPPNTATLAALPINLTNSTGNEVRTLSTASPPCRDAPGSLCMCDTCDNSASTPCFTNADCGKTCDGGANDGLSCTNDGGCPSGHCRGGTTCGGKRCQTGANRGAPCANNSECPGSACGVPGLATRPNQCDGGPSDCVAGGTPGPNDGQCASGPTDFSCTPNATMIPCSGQADCDAAGLSSCQGGGKNGAVCTGAGDCPGGSCVIDTCTGVKTRECFLDNGVDGGQDKATGHADPPDANGEGDPTLAALFCIGPTSKSGVNSAAGLPGLGRLELQGHAKEIP